MRSLQRLRHTRPPAPRQVTRIRRAEDAGFDRRKRVLWRGRVRRLASLALLGLALFGAIGFVTRGVVLDGLVVHPNMVTPRAPAPVRVAQLFVEPGTRCRRGDVLLRLEALETASRRALEEEVAEQETRLALVLAGGELDGSDLGRRLDSVGQAELEARLSRSEHEAALARLHALEQEHESLLARHEEEQTLRAGQTASIHESLQIAATEEAKALAQNQRAGFDAERVEALRAEGLVSRQESLGVEMDHEQAKGDLNQAAAQVHARRRELDVSTDLARLERARAQEGTDAMQARIDVAQREVRTAELRAELWEELAARRRTLVPESEPGTADLSELELDLVRAQLRRARAKLEELDRRIGNREVRAECDGIVDQVFVNAGSVVDADAPLLRYYDPSDVRVEVYAEPDDSADLLRGAACRVFPTTGAAALEARVGTVGLSWVALPPLLRTSDEKHHPAPRLPASLECEGPEVHERLQPNMRVRVVLQRPLWPWE